jgi:asparagine synthase (glutamine-hydrolysing)
MVSQDSRYVLVFNGEVYNFRNLRSELEVSGIRFRSTGDAEVVLYALAHWGVDALNLFNGMFALGFYDSQEKRLLIARDHAGIKPLYYLHTTEGLFFASQYDQILAHPWSKDLPVSEEALALYLRLGYIPAPYAILGKTHMLPPGTWLEIDSDRQAKKGAFFQFPVFREPDLKAEAAYEAVDSAVSRAVKRHLISDVPVGIFLSGGIDSPLIAAKVRASGNAALPAFSIGTDDDRFDESQDARAYADELGLNHYLKRITPQDALDLLDDVVEACSEPFADYSIFPTMLVSRLASQHVKVVLSGDGGDELFWGYVPRLSSVLERANVFRQARWMRYVRLQVKRYLHVGNGFQGMDTPNIGDWYLHKHTRVSPSQTIFPDLPWPQDFTAFEYRDWKSDQTAQWLRWNEYVSHLTMVLLKVDRASMFHSLEVRVPLLDREVIEVASRVDWKSCLDMRQQAGKLPLRYALKQSIRHQSLQKRGFDVPMGSWLQGALRPAFEEMVCEANEILGVPLNQQAVRLLFDRHLSGQADRTQSLWTLLSLALWERKHQKPRAGIHLTLNEHA